MSKIYLKPHLEMKKRNMGFSKARLAEKKEEIPENEDVFYWSLVTRNQHFVPEDTQVALRNIRVLVAGCGSAGGACIESLARLGVTKFRLVDNGAYELSNLNRQHAYIDSIGVNKATFHEKQVLRINPYIDVKSDSRGLTPENCGALVEWADVIMDCVDVTSQSSIQMKFLLHETAHRYRKPTFSPLDVGFRQWGIGFDYRDPRVGALNGNLESARNAKHPIKALFKMFPLSCVPSHCLDLIYELLTKKDVSASQLGCASDTLSSIMAAVMVRYAGQGEVVPMWNIDLASFALTPAERRKTFIYGIVRRKKIRKMLKALD